MRDIQHEVATWLEQGSELALAQVIKTWGSSPRVAGSVMVVDAQGRIAGSVSGGCLESSVVQSALECLGEELGEGLGEGSARYEKYHATNQDAREVGLSCGGDMDVLIARLDPALFWVEREFLRTDTEYLRVSVASVPHTASEGNESTAFGAADANAANGAADAKAGSGAADANAANGAADAKAGSGAVATYAAPTAAAAAKSGSASADANAASGVSWTSASGVASTNSNNTPLSTALGLSFLITTARHAPQAEALALAGNQLLVHSFLVDEVTVATVILPQRCDECVQGSAAELEELVRQILASSHTARSGIVELGASGTENAPCNSGGGSTCAGNANATANGTTATYARNTSTTVTSTTAATTTTATAGTEYFFVKKTPEPTLICIGGVHIAVHLTRLAQFLGYRTIVIDPRRIFSTQERFPTVDELVHAWPQQAFEHISLNSSSAVCALTHDPKIDVPALAYALRSKAFYIGSLGRYTTQLSRYRALQEQGFDDTALARIYGPIGLDLGGREPEEIALSIMAEITAVRRGSTLKTATMLESAKRARASRQST